ncbi:MAG: hypothetical protein HFG88_08285 [Dorea sp.]|nr:hypothetical protein [Dorea sp.]
MEETRKNKKEEDIVKETWGSMTAGKKIEYLWMYYKGWLAGAVCVVLAVCLGVTMYKGRHTNVFLNVIVVGGDNLKAEWLAEEFSQYADIDGKEGIVRVRANIPDDGGGMTSTTALTTLMGAGAVDVLICPERVYEEYGSQGGFQDMGEVLGERAGDYGEAVLDSGVCLKGGNILEQEEMVAYDKVYAALPVNGQNQETAARFIEYLLQ